MAKGQHPQKMQTDGRHPRRTQPETEQDAPSREPRERVAVKLRSNVPAEVRDVSFSAAVRGYDRREVDAYVERVNRVIAELEISRSPEAAVKHALDRVGEQTSGVLQRAREVAEELTATSLAEAEETTRSARAEADEIVDKAQMDAHQLRGRSKEEAEAIVAKAQGEASRRMERLERQLKASQDRAEQRLRELEADADTASQTRDALLADLRRMAAALQAFANGARVGSDAAPDTTHEQPTEATGEQPTEATDEQPTEATGEQPTEVKPASRDA